MSWVTPRTWTPEEFVTALMMQGISDALSETAPAKAANAGEMFRALAANSIEAFGPPTFGQILAGDGDGIPQWMSAYAAGDVQQQYVSAEVTTTTFANWVRLSGGPSVTVEVGASGLLEVCFSVEGEHTNAGAYAAASISVYSGSAPSPAVSIGEESVVLFKGQVNSAKFPGGRHFFVSGLTPGPNVVEIIYISDGAAASTAKFWRRLLWARSLG